MLWELSDGVAVRGPLEDADVVALIRQGLNTATVCRPVGRTSWKGLRSYAPFAIAIESATAGATLHAPAPPTRRAGVSTLMLGAIGAGIGILVIVGWAVGSSLSSPKQVRAEPEKPAASAVVAPTHPAPTVDRAATEKRVANEYAKLAPADRMAGVARCVENNACPAGELEGLFASGADADERKALTGYGWALMGAKGAKLAVDGPELNGKLLGLVAASLQKSGIVDMLKLPKTSRAEASKDPAAERGKAVGFAGTIVQIERHGTLFMGTMQTDGGWVYFVTPGETKGLLEGSRATLVGIFAQKYWYSNKAGGQTESLLVVGRFRWQKDSNL